MAKSIVCTEVKSCAIHVYARKLCVVPLSSVSTPAESKDVTPPLGRVHIDLVRLPNISSFGIQVRYELIAIDEFSRYAHTRRFLKYVNDCFRTYVSTV